ASPNVSVSANDGDGGVGSDSHAVTVSNVPPTVTLAATNTYTWPESATAERTFDYTASDPAGANDPLTMTINCGTGGVYVAGSDTGSSFKCRFPDGPASPNVSVSANDGDGGVGSDSHAVTVSNVPPTVAKPTFQPVLIACQTSTTLTGISFSDPGANDNPWTVDIDWGDSSAHTTYITATQGAQPNQDHTYSTPGPHTATVTVTDKDTDSGSNTSTAPVTVFQYTVDFLPPFDDSTPSGLIVNKMKNGRVVPVKARIRDECAGSIVTDPTHVVTIKVTKTSGSGAGDPIEEYADAGESSAGTNEFRPTGDHWIYNLDSKALGLVINNLYRIDVYVDGVKATVTNWAVLQPVK
ncbi:MAG: PKD domain-containing protein, partial [Chloroflexota bacterium]|nr:PKD domain-containing protein [Chloroflexota bacterium]